jgi:hypothetical protein
MSSEERLVRLGLVHVADDPEQLARTLDALRAARRKHLSEWSASAPAMTKAEAPRVDRSAEIAELYDRIGGGARDRTGRPVKAPGAKPTSTRNAAPLVTAAAFAAKMQAIGADVSEFLPKLGALPEQMRILTLEALYGAQSKEEIDDIVAQTSSMLTS